METLKRSKAIVIVTTALFFGSLLWLANTTRINHRLEKAFENEKLKSEELLSEKLLLEKNLVKIKGQLFAFQDRNLDLDNVIKNTKAIIDTREAEYSRMKKENHALGQTKKQRDELLSIKKQLQNELQAVKISHAELLEKNHELLKTVKFLQERNLLLANDLERPITVAVDQCQILAVKSNSEKLTVRARQTKKLVANFAVQANLENIAFRISDPKGNILTQKDGTIASTPPPAKTFTASSDPKAHGTKLQKIEMMFIPTEKLKSGVYTVEISNANQYVGSLKVKLK